MKKLPDIDYLITLLDYNPETGEITWKDDRGTNKCKGKPAGGLNYNGYRRLMVRGKQYQASRIAWALYYGEDPYPLTIDHINRNRDDNRIKNLRTADSKLQSDNQEHRGGTPGKPVRIIYPDGRGVIEVDSVTTAAKVLNLTRQTVSSNLRRGNKQLYWGTGKTNPSGIRLEWAVWV